MKLKVFLYLLTRDHLNTGAIENILNIVRQLDTPNVTYSFSSKQVAALAQSWAEELQEEEDDK